MSEVANMAHTYQWLNNSNIRANTKALIMAGQEQALNTRTVAREIYHAAQDRRCRLCKEHAETVEHIISVCSKLAGTNYTERHNNASIVYRVICTEYDI